LFSPFLPSLRENGGGEALPQLAAMFEEVTPCARKIRQHLKLEH
jgi:hypothetical protein